MTKLSLKLNQPNNLTFQVTIKGSVYEAVETPRFYLEITEKADPGKFGVIFPGVFIEGLLQVTVPAMGNVFKENVEYIGELRAIVGNQYLTPAKMDFDFVSEAVTEIEVKMIVEKTPEQKPPVAIVEKPTVQIAPPEVLGFMIGKLFKPTPPPAVIPPVVQTKTKETSKPSGEKEALKSLLRESLED